jgi:hypothetical protein
MLGNQSNNRRIPLGRNVDPAGVASDGEAPASQLLHFKVREWRPTVLVPVTFVRRNLATRRGRRLETATRADCVRQSYPSLLALTMSKGVCYRNVFDGITYIASECQLTK